MREISSKQNNLIKQIKKLKDKKYRYEYGLFVDEGIKNIDMSLSSDYLVRCVLFRQDFADKKFIEKLELHLGPEKIHFVKEEVFDSVKDTVNSQGVIAVYEMKRECISEYAGKDELQKRHCESGDRILILDGINDPGNLGTIVRTALAGGIKTIYYTHGTADFYSPKTVRSAMGSLYFADIRKLYDLSELKGKGYRIYASALRGAVDYKGSFTDRKIALVIGSEANGVSDQILMQSDKKIKIPIDDSVAESLNASVAAGILIFEMEKQ